MNIEIETQPYNTKEKGRPWIARVTFNTPPGEFHWGVFVGAPGEPGVLAIENVEPGDVVARGQKDWASKTNGTPVFYKVTEDGDLERFPSRAAAWRHWNLMFSA